MSLATVQPIEKSLEVPAFEYRAKVTSRVAYRDFETTETGGVIYSELVHFEDSLGRLVVREATISEPNPNKVTVMPYAVTETDPWTTGARGLNRDKVRRYTDLGFPTIWLHHAGKESPIAKDKSTSRSAHQMHALLDDLADNHTADLKKVILRGYSRGDMTGEKFIALSHLYGREVPASDMEALCFTRDMSIKEKAETLVRQLPGEVIGIGKLVVALTKQAVQEKNPDTLMEYAKTLDVHPRNLMQEFMWASALINANVGQSISVVPSDTVGIRTLFVKDYMSQHKESQELYARFPGIQVFLEQGPHVAGAFPQYLAKSIGRLSNIGNYIVEHDMSINGITSEDISLLPSAEQKSKAVWGLTSSF